MNEPAAYYDCPKRIFLFALKLKVTILFVNKSYYDDAVSAFFTSAFYEEGSFLSSKVGSSIFSLNREKGALTF